MSYGVEVIDGNVDCKMRYESKNRVDFMSEVDMVKREFKGFILRLYAKIDEEVCMENFMLN